MMRSLTGARALEEIEMCHIANKLKVRMKDPPNILMSEELTQFATSWSGVILCVIWEPKTKMEKSDIGSIQ